MWGEWNLRCLSKSTARSCRPLLLPRRESEVLDDPLLLVAEEDTSVEEEIESLRRLDLSCSSDTEELIVLRAPTRSYWSFLWKKNLIFCSRSSSSSPLWLPEEPPEAMSPSLRLSPLLKSSLQLASDEDPSSSINRSEVLLPRRLLPFDGILLSQQKLDPLSSLTRIEEEESSERLLGIPMFPIKRSTF